ncbi:HEAT repeat protein, partial [Oesophagostomum dentatum]
VTQKLIHNAETASLFVRVQIAKCILRFLNSRDMSIQQAALEILGRVADWSAVCRVELCASTAIDICLQLIPHGDLLTQKLCVSLLRILSCEEQAREQIRIYDGVPVLVGLLSVRNPRLQWHVAWSLAQLAEDVETSVE